MRSARVVQSAFFVYSYDMNLLLDGKKVREFAKTELLAKVLAVSKNSNSPKPSLVIFQIGDRLESNMYVANKIRFGESIGISVILKKFPENAQEEDVKAEIIKANEDKSVNGIIVQLPLPANFNKLSVIDSVSPEKDADGLTSKNTERFLAGDDKAVIPATARGIKEIISFFEIEIKGKNAVVVGRSSLVGRPTAVLLERMGANVTVCHRGTGDIPAETSKADILVVAAGSPGLIKANYVKAGQTVIDVGLTVIVNPDGTKKILGDVAFDEVSPIVEKITPVPGGVGLMTVVALFQNVWDLFERQNVLK